jgi:LDH2 family malate/lactate/ureidoglycolate dehydrogenase
MVSTRKDVAMVISAEALKAKCCQLLVRAGMPEEAAGQCAEALVEADLEGTLSHGVMRLPIYLAAIERGQLDPAGAVRFEQTAAATGVVAGGNTLGQVVSVTAMRAAIELASKAGIGSVTARHSNHFGAASYYTNMAAKAGMVGVAATNSPPALPAWGGKEAYLGTNPLALAFPTRAGEPLSIDLSLSVVARGKIIQAAKAGQPIPAGWAVDKEGRATTDPKAALTGALLPLGGAKGFALALAIEILAGMLSGAAFGPHVNSILEQDTNPANVGHWFLAIDIKRFLPLDTFLDQLEIMVAELKASSLAEGYTEIRLPGERRAQLRQQQLAEGIHLPDETVKALNEWASKLQVEPLPV